MSECCNEWNHGMKPWSTDCREQSTSSEVDSHMTLFYFVERVVEYEQQGEERDNSNKQTVCHGSGERELFHQISTLENPTVLWPPELVQVVTIQQNKIALLVGVPSLLVTPCTYKMKMNGKHFLTLIHYLKLIKLVGRQIIEHF